MENFVKENKCFQAAGIAKVSVKMNLQTNMPGESVTVELPEGYTEENCIVLAIAKRYESGSLAFYNDLQNGWEGEGVFGVTVGDKNMYVKRKNLYSQYPKKDTTIDVEVWLMKVSE